MISKNTIDRVFDTARVEEVIGEFVNLKKSGSNFKGLSPFSDEKTPSFMVSPVKQIWKDFSSGKGGNVVAFLMEHEHYSYPEAIRYLAKKYGIEIEETELTDEQKQQADERESLFLVSEFARDQFRDNLWNDDRGKAIGLTYFRERGFSDELIKKFQLGYAIDDWDHFTEIALQKGYDLKYLEQTGLTIVKQDLLRESGIRKFDRFKGRVMFPIQSMSGRVLGFGGRILGSDKKAAKYLNSPESIIYHKSNILYGIYHAKQQIAKENNCYLVEGYTDVMGLHKMGIENVVSSSGTALTERQIHLIHRLTNNITILFDGDQAGIRASLRGIDLILEQGLNVRVVMFPQGEDPDSFAKNVSPEAFKEYLSENSRDFINFKVSLLTTEAQNDPVKKAGLIRDIVVSISKIPDRIKQEVYIQECSRIMDISEHVLFSELAQLDKRERREASRRPVKEVPQAPVMEKTGVSEEIDQLHKYEKELITILLLYGNKEIEFEEEPDDDEMNNPAEGKLKKRYYKSLISREIFLNMQDDEIEFSDALFRGIYFDIMDVLNQDKSIDFSRFVNHENPKVSALVTEILMDEEQHAIDNWERKKIYPKKKDDEGILNQKVIDAIYNLRRVLISQIIQAFLEENNLDEERDQKLEMIRDYNSLKIKIASRLRRVV